MAGQVDKSKDHPKAPLETFKEAIRSSGSLVIDCDLCGRVHFGSGGDFDEGELESLREKQEKDPVKYIEHDGFVSYGYIEGKQAVLDCPCNKLGLYERWILNHKFLIMDYLSQYAKERFEEADQLHKVANDTAQLMAALRRKENTNGKTRVFDFD